MNGPIPAGWSGTLHSVLRMVAGLLILMHGSQKLLGWPAPPQMPVTTFSLMWFAGVIELVGGVCLILGFLTRPMAFLLAGEMAYAFFMVHVKNGGIFPLLNGGELAALNCFVFLYFGASGPGPIALMRDGGHADPRHRRS